MNEFLVTVIRGFGRKQRRIMLTITAKTKGRAIRAARQSLYMVGRARISQVRQVTA